MTNAPEASSPNSNANTRVIVGMSGGVDSSVVAALLHKAIGTQLTCVFVDNGLLRKAEGDQVNPVLLDDAYVMGF